MRPDAGDAGRDHQHVVAQRPAIGEVHHAVVRVHLVDLGEHQVDAVTDELVPRPHDAGRVVDAERHEQITGLVMVRVVAVDDGDVQLVLAEAARSLLAIMVPAVPAEDYQALHR